MLRAGDKKRLKEAWLAKTPKYFFYDYGAACGTRFQGKVCQEDDADGTYITGI